MKPLISSVIFAVLASLALAQAPQLKTAEVSTHPARGDVHVVEGAEARLVATESGVTFNLFTTGLNPGNVYTAWLVVISNPAACSASPCSGQDVLEHTAEVQANVSHADGIIADEHGIGNFFAHLAPGPVDGGWYDTEFTNPLGAEVHLVLMDHGPVIEELLADMLTSLRGGCTDESVPAAYPEVAKSDGTPGPNTCQLYQVAIFP